ncbi:7876_t:CDS:1, partial [Cetraspora pellucida]
MATTTRAKHHQLEKQQSTLSEDYRFSENQSLDYISDDNNIFIDDYDGDKTDSVYEEDHLQITSHN